MAGRNFIFVHWVLPLVLIGAGISAYVYVDWQEALLGDFRGDPRIDVALGCSVEDMWVHQQDTEWVGEMGELLDPDGNPPDEIASSAGAGNPEAMFMMAVMQLAPLDGDSDAGLDWLRRSAEAGYPMAQGELGAADIYGYNGMPVDRTRGRDWLARAAAQGEPYAQYSLARLHEASISSNTRKQGLDLLLSSAAQCFPSASSKLSQHSGFRGSIPGFAERARALGSRVDAFEERGGHVQL